MADSLINTAPIEFEKGDFQADLAQSVGTRDARAGGMTIDRAMLKGFQSRQTTKDPLYDLRVMEYRSRISENAAQAANYSRQLLIKNAEIVAEQRDRNILTRLSLKYKGKPREALQALSETNVESVWGLKAMNEQRQAITTLMDMDAVESTWAKASVYQRAKAVNFEKGSQEWWDAIGVPPPARQGVDPTDVRLLEAAQQYRIDGDETNAARLEAIVTERGRNKGVADKMDRTVTVTETGDYGKKVTRRLTESEAAAIPVPTDQETSKQLSAYASEKAALAAGDKSAGPDWMGLSDRARKLGELKIKLEQKGINPDTGRRLGATSSMNAPAASAPASKIVIQNGQRFQVNADGTSTHLGPAQ